ncbi:MAG TPA: hypothetical protein VJ952_09455 [Opitutales bacterium]|nr:hypothetical protein [Opitutales bacterium]
MFIGRIVLGGAILATALSACTTRFSDDFEADPLGSPPLVEPAGLPDDRVYILDGTGEIRITGSGPINGAQSLRIAGPSDGGASAPNTFMYAETLSDSNQPVYAAWTGRFSGDAAARVFLWTGHYSTMVELVFSDGQVAVNGEEIGTFEPGAEYTVLIRATPSNDSYGVSVLGAGVSGSTTGTVLNPSVFPQSNIGMTFQLIGGGASDSYVIDAVRMSERKPPEDMPSG